MKHGKSANLDAPAAVDAPSPKGNKPEGSDSEKIISLEKKKKQKKQDKKRKNADTETEGQDKSETSSELGEAVNLKAEKKKAKHVSGKQEEEGGESDDPNALTKFRISEALRSKLISNGICSLFPIQARTFDDILNGSDLVGRARTGQGKTLAFVLPILESLTNYRTKELRKTGYGRPPCVLVLLPTRELANQVYEDFNTYGGVMNLTSCCVYGGASYKPQELNLKRGVDIVIGTPGRIKDLIEKGHMDLSTLLFRVLDEADEMLRMGFVEDVEFILGKVSDVNKVQTLLFSATLPDWVKNISARFLKPAKKTIDLVGNEKVKASTNVRHIVLPCMASAIPHVIPDIISCYSSGGRTIIFTEKKESTNELAGLLPGARALHGDMQQSQREQTLAAFRSGKFMTLVATNVAARGLDINDVQLIIQCEPPHDAEAYIHRSGRTGRAGNTGVAVMLYDPRKSRISRIEKESGIKFEHITAPQPADIAKFVGAETAKGLAHVSDSVIPVFKTAAEDLMQNSGLSPTELLAKALAKASGYTELKSRSILTGSENHVTLLLESERAIHNASFACNLLRNFVPEDKVKLVKGVTITASGDSAVLDVPAEHMDTFLKGQQRASDVSLEVIKTLPPLQQSDFPRGRYSGGRGGGRGKGGGFGNRSGGRSGFSRGRGGGGGSRGRNSNRSNRW